MDHSTMRDEVYGKDVRRWERAERDDEFFEMW